MRVDFKNGSIIDREYALIAKKIESNSLFWFNWKKKKEITLLMFLKIKTDFLFFENKGIVRVLWNKKKP